MGDLPTELNLHQFRACRHLERTSSEHRLVHGTRDDGAVLSTVVNGGVIDHPVTHEPREPGGGHWRCRRGGSRVGRPTLTSVAHSTSADESWTRAGTTSMDLGYRVVDDKRAIRGSPGRRMFAVATRATSTRHGDELHRRLIAPGRFTPLALFWGRKRRVTRRFRPQLRVGGRNERCPPRWPRGCRR